MSRVPFSRRDPAQPVPYFSSAATYRTLTGRDPHSSAGLAEQTRILAEVSQALFAGLGERAEKESP